jgi:membrane protease YdiL (CAAX protease family)
MRDSDQLGELVGPTIIARKNRSPQTFLLLLFALSISLWIFGSIYDVQIFPGFNLYQLPLAMPMVTALILIYREGGKAGVVELLKRTYDCRNIKSKVWYFPMLLMIPSIGLVEYLIVRLSGASLPSPQFSVATLGYISVFFMTYGEELGWTGYLIDPMQERWSALKSGILLGIVWAVIHFPIHFINGYSFQWIFWHGLYTVAVRVLMVWIYNNTGRSLFGMALTHWTFGIFWSLWPVENMHRTVPFYDPRIMAFTAIFYAAIVVLLWGPKTLAQYRFSHMGNKGTTN